MKLNKLGKIQSEFKKKKRKKMEEYMYFRLNWLNSDPDDCLTLTNILGVMKRNLFLQLLLSRALSFG